MRKLFFLPLLALILKSTQLSAQPVITSQPANQNVVWGGNAMFSVMATGVGPFTYQWQLNGTNLPNNIITTVTGGQLFNNLPATNTILNSAYGVATDGAGNLYVADTDNNVIRKMGTNGWMTIVAGNGSGSFSGDGGAATNAGLLGPTAMIVDTAGNLLIADSSNNRIRKVGTNGIISTVAGNGQAYVTFSPYAVGDGGAATNGTLSYPNGLALDTNGNLFIADNGNNRIAKVGTNGIIVTVAGIPSLSGHYLVDGVQATSTSLNFPSGVAVDSSNNLFIADSQNARIRKVNASGIISTVAGNGTFGYSGDGGTATSAKVNFPTGVALDTAHNLFIVDSGNHCIRKLAANIITTVAGNSTNGYSGDGGIATNASLSNPNCAAVDSLGNLYIADRGNSRIRKVGTNGIIATEAGRALNDGDFATNATFNSAWAIAKDSLGNLYVADTWNNCIRKVDTNGVITTVAGNGVPTYSGDGVAATNASLNQPSGVAVDAFGNLLIADTFNNRIRKVDMNGIISTVAGTGAVLFSGDGGAATNAKLWQPYGIAVDGVGNFYVADTRNNRVRKVDTNGVITTAAGNGGFSASGDGGAATNASFYLNYSVAVDSIGNLFITDRGNNRIRKVNTNGIITTVAGNGAFGYSGDGGAATNASLNLLLGVMVDSAGNFYISDHYHPVVCM